ncbi:MAG TPA: PIN domain-containing protein [Gemmataceae bacterium]
MILVDTSGVIDHLRSGDAKLLGLFRSLPGAVCGVTRAEVLHGARNPADRGRLLTVLNAFHQVPIPDSLWDTVGDMMAALRAVGVTVPFPDAAIASVAVSAGVELWSRDNQFQLIQRVEPRLLLFQEPP